MFVQGAVTIVPLSWVVFAVWMAVVWPDLRVGGRIFLGTMLIWAGLGFYYVGAVALVMALSVLESLKDGPWFEFGIVAGCWLLVPLPYYFTWQYWRRERSDAAGRH